MFLSIVRGSSPHGTTLKVNGNVWMLPANCPLRLFPLVDGIRSASSLSGSKGTGVILQIKVYLFLIFSLCLTMPTLLVLFRSSILQQSGSQIWRQEFLSTNLALALRVAWPWQVTSTLWDSIIYKVEIRKLLKLWGLCEINVKCPAS